MGKEVSGVGEVSVIPMWNGPGTVKVVIVDSLNQPAISDLITAISEHIEELRPIGANVTVVSATALTVNISVNVTNDVTEEMTENIKTVISNYLSGDAIKKSTVCALAMRRNEKWTTHHKNQVRRLPFIYTGGKSEAAYS